MPAKARTKPSAEIRHLKARTGIFSPVFLAGDANKTLLEGEQITTKQATAVAEAIKGQFEVWWESWIEPELARIEKRGL